MIKKLKTQIVLIKILFILLKLGKFLKPVLREIGIPYKEKINLKDLYIYSNILSFYSPNKFYEIINKIKK